MKNRISPNTVTLRLPDIMAVVGAYFLSQAFYMLSGGKFELFFLSRAPLLLDNHLLTTKLLESVWYMHIQPPLWNLYTGLILKIFPAQYGLAFQITFLTMGLAMALSILWLLRNLGVSRWLSLAVTIGYVINPADIIYRNLYYYSYPVMASLVLSAVALFCYLSTEKPAYGYVFFAVLFILGMTRSTYHIIWLLAITAWLIIMVNNHRACIVKMAILPLVLILFWMWKNYCLFDSFSLTSWLGMHLGNISTMRLSPEEKKTLIDEGKISPLSTIRTYGYIEEYSAYLDHINVKRTPIDSLNQMFKSNVQSYAFKSNYNYEPYLLINKQYLRDAIATIRNYPRAYLRGIGVSIAIFFNPSWIWDGDEPSQGIPTYYLRGWSLLEGSMYPLLMLRPSSPAATCKMDRTAMICWFILAFYLCAPALLLRDLLRHTGISKLSYAQKMTMGYILLNIGYVTITGILLDCGENNRFRLEIVPSSMIILGLLVQCYFDTLSQRFKLRKNSRG